MPPDLHSRGGRCKLRLYMGYLSARLLIVSYRADHALVAADADCCAAPHYSTDDWQELSAVSIRAGIKAAHLGPLPGQPLLTGVTRHQQLHRQQLLV